MYTQCPDCSTAFRVTADVLKQAAGKVRCGGCGNAFNALAYLSESMPEQPAPVEADAALPELQPESPPTDGLPVSISAEQSAALLKTLDELAGSDIRIEDTGVEWRVLDDDEVGDGAADEHAVKEANDELYIDEILDESPTPVDQFLTETPAIVDSPEIFEEPPLEFSRTSVDELRFDDNTPLPEDFELDVDEFVIQQPNEIIAEAAPQEEVEEEPQADLDLSEPDEWTDILGEFVDLAEAVAAPLEAELAEAELKEAALEKAELGEAVALAEEAAEETDSDDDSIDEPLDMDSQFALQAEAMGIDLSGMQETLDAEEEIPIAEDVDLDELLNQSNSDNLELEDLLDEEFVEEIDDQEFGDEEIEDEPGLEIEDPDEVEQFDLIEDADDSEEELTDLEEDFGNDFEEGPGEALKENLDEDEYDSSHNVPPLTKEEQTINMQIDQDLLALAIEDEDGFASTIIIPEDVAEYGARKKRKKKGKDIDDAEEALKDTGAGFETIIMEGEAFRSTEDLDELDADTAAVAKLTGAAAAERAAEAAAGAGSKRYGIIGGIVILVLLIAAQAVHQSRETLATIPAFNNAVGPLYRAIGKPLSPDWDVTGWRFEATKGSTDDDEDLTIYSRLGNKSDKPLPYPLIGISLTNRLLETIGSRILDPADYLSNDLDPRKLVQPGNTFNAVITIPSPAEEATGFKLNVCYRESDGSLRCAIDDFK